MLYLCRVKPLRHYLRGFLIAAWAGDKIAEFSFPEISFHFPLRPWFFFVSPAYAGKSHSYLNSTFLNLGSPPCMRGKEGAVLVQLCKDRITPACAGKRTRPQLYAIASKDHPRVCGEKKVMRGAKDKRMGSPPHVRGKAFLLTPAMVLSRITPACAGKSWSNALPCSRREDHPRVCGEKFFAAYGAMPLSGSPPRMRGKDQIMGAYRGD